MDSAETPSVEALLEQVNTDVQDHIAQCCCGRQQCAFLAHNSAALAGLEKDLVSAAQIGQALLIRHESHMVEAEAERIRMTATVEKLEDEKRRLELDNAKKIEENRMLLDRLEELNQQCCESDTQVQSLTASLQATKEELERLAMLTQRTASLEAQLIALESEHSELQNNYTTTEEGHKSALQRWRRAESTIGQLQTQVDRIEREAKEERERHMEVIGRMERTRAVEKELDSAAGRLKGAAAATSLGKLQSDSSVVSHFVRDILQDNANLQSGVMELRELLLTSNAEVESLRNQLQVHRPLEESDGALATLSHELKENDVWSEHSQTPEASSLHVHHHYHAPNITVRKTKKKRPSFNTHVSSVSGSSTPRASRIRDWRASTPSSFATILSQTSASVPSGGHQHRWSNQSGNTLSSFTSSSPSSPRHNSSIFDAIEGAIETSPTSPASSVQGSPTLLASDLTVRKPVARSFSGPLAIQLKSQASLGNLNTAATSAQDVIPPLSLPNHFQSDAFGGLPEPIKSPFGTETIMEEGESSNNDITYGNGESEVCFVDEMSITPRLRRAASHESLLSVSGMDIHTLQDRPSQLLLGTAASPRHPYASSFASSLSPQPATSRAIATGRPIFNSRDSSSGVHAQSILASVHTGAENKPSLTQKVGGWVWSKWGAAPVVSSDHPRSQPPSEQPALRPFGINQKGPIPGLAPPKKAPVQVETERIDSALLQESLADALGPGIAG